jgi:hypothetical protein
MLTLLTGFKARNCDRRYCEVFARHGRIENRECEPAASLDHAREMGL